MPLIHGDTIQMLYVDTSDTIQMLRYYPNAFLSLDVNILYINYRFSQHNVMNVHHTPGRHKPARDNDIPWKAGRTHPRDEPLNKEMGARVQMRSDHLQD